MEIMKDYFEKVIVALDHEKPEDAYELIDEVGDLIQWFKIGPVLFSRSHEEVIQFLHRRQKKIFLDLKVHDIPVIAANTVKQYADMGVQFATIHCLGGRAMLEAAGLHCRGSQLKLLGVTLLTSQTAKEIGSLESDDEIVMRLVRLAVETRLTGVLCSAHEVSAVKKGTLPGFLTVTAGIRILGEEVFQDDQQRVSTALEAIEAGADYLIVGRPITSAREPGEAVRRLFNK